MCGSSEPGQQPASMTALSAMAALLAREAAIIAGSVNLTSLCLSFEIQDVWMCVLCMF